MTIIDLLDADSPDAYGTLVRDRASATWGAWSAHHVQVREWMNLALT